MSSGQDLAREVIGRLSRAAGFLNDNERHYDLPIACEAAKETLLRGATRLVAESANRPMLASKSADGTPITVVHRMNITQPGGQKVHSSGKECK